MNQLFIFILHYSIPLVLVPIHYYYNNIIMLGLSDKGVSRVTCDENLIISCATEYGTNTCVFILNWCSLYFRKISDKKSEIYHFNAKDFVINIYDSILISCIFYQ